MITFSYGKLQRLRGKQRWNFWKKEDSMIEPPLPITSMLLTTKRRDLFNFLFIYFLVKERAIKSAKHTSSWK